ncbi:hypothetical protein P152DRAFT_447991 [Eremomyces bilateralis CBS 781.70]|uniref:SPX domain-containing protein n=1 Tax=Eremomyces bilateralis CBS 781.70 TaxID=1392243 RepID=A0A6G1G9J5_9PEZI|nr:uncharacterized protein P152DRAFT_447991 [Eremomyces bilateralis CBS 781.70]KAF1814662.1 hypothetical protein P152DRAFT_447991 [Eremomyces bilateralis CBS 781.70]
MKFGETLRARSIPEWAHFNIAYDEIKYLIKQHTTNDAVPGKSVAIPGHEDVRDDEFAKDLYRVLEKEHARTCLFVKSKKGEVERRLELGSNARGLADLRKRYLAIQERYEAAPRKRIPPRRLEKFAQLENEILRAGQILKSLSRFMVTQYTAFQKLLKKYRRWTNDTELPDRFREKVLGRPGGLQRENLDPLLDEWTLLLAEVRSLVTTRADDRQLRTLIGGKASVINAASTTRKSPDPTDLPGMGAAGRKCSSLDFDTGIATLSFDQKSKHASYWIHTDHIIELHVLLLQHLKLFSPSEQDKPRLRTATSSRNISRRLSADSGNGQSIIEGAEVGCVIVDDLELYGEKQSGGAEPVAPAALARWTSTGEGRVIVPREGATGFDVAPVKRKRLSGFLDLHNEYIYSQRGSGIALGKRSNPNGAPSSKSSVGADESSLQQKERDERNVRSWLMEHPNLKPQATVMSQRTRFVGLTNNAEQGIWVALDRGLEIYPGLETTPGDSNSVLGEQRAPIHFPFALLTVLSVGPHNLFKTLDSSHLLQRVFNFNLATHAIWECHLPADLMSPPSWLDLLSKDIRKIPKDATPRRRRSTNPRITPTSSGQASNAQSAGNISSGAERASRGGETSATSITIASESGGADARSSVVIADIAVPPSGAEPYRSQHKSRGQHWERISRARRARIQVAEANRLGGHPKLLSANAARYWSEYDNPEDESNENAYVIYIDPNDHGTPFLDFFSSLPTRIASLFSAADPPIDDSSPLIESDDFPTHRSTLHRPSTSSSSSSSSSSAADSDNSPTTTHPPRAYSTFAPPSQPTPPPCPLPTSPSPSIHTPSSLPLPPPRHRRRPRPPPPPRRLGLRPRRRAPRRRRSAFDQCRTAPVAGGGVSGRSGGGSVEFSVCGDWDGVCDISWASWAPRPTTASSRLEYYQRPLTAPAIYAISSTVRRSPAPNSKLPTDPGTTVDGLDCGIGPNAVIGAP